MNTARIVVLTIAVGAGGIAAHLASGSDNRPLPAGSVAQLPTVGVLVAKSEIGLGQTVKPEDMRWQTWPAASASRTVTLELKPEQSKTLARARQRGSLTLALRSIADLNVVDTRSDENATRRSGSIHVVRCDVAIPTTTQT